MKERLAERGTREQVRDCEKMRGLRRGPERVRKSHLERDTERLKEADKETGRRGERRRGREGERGGEGDRVIDFSEEQEKGT